MKIDKYVNAVFTTLFGLRPDGERKVWFHSQNLNEDRDGNVKGLPWHGRFWLRTYKRPLVHFSWNLWTHFCGISVQADGEDAGTQFHISLPPVAFWLTLPIGTKSWGYSSRVLFDIKVHDWAIWWQFGGSKHSWSSRTPKWKDGNFNFQDFFLGKTSYECKVIKTHEVFIPMPEGKYEATVSMEEASWKRPRWFTKTQRSAKVDIPIGIPHQGKGENSWDCGEDRLFGVSVAADTLEEAIAKTVQNALRSRRRYDGDVMAEYPDPKNYVRPPPPEPTQEQASA